MNNVDLQKEEILALRSIYDGKELMIENENPVRGRFDASVQLPPNFYVYCGKKMTKYGGNYEIEYLPPINLFFEFPETYPSSTCPAFLLSCSWLQLSQLSELCKKLESLWEENTGEVVLFRWIDFLVNEVLSFLKITDTLDLTELLTYKSSKFCDTSNPSSETSQGSSSSCIPNENGLCQNDDLEKSSCQMGDHQCKSTRAKVLHKDKMQVLHVKPSIHSGCSKFDCRAVLDLKNGALLPSLLVRYNSNKKNEAFLNEWCMCDICFSTKKGSEFMRFNKCDHLYCKECLKSYFEVQIKEGNVYALNCPTANCESKAEAGEVKQLVSVELFQKYDDLLLSRTLDGMDDVVYCPRKLCQTAVISDLDHNMGRCPQCEFVFCLYCRMAYHGVAPCNFKFAQRKDLCLKYLEADADEKVKLEKRYGKRELQMVVNDILSEEWMDTNSKKCPHCQTVIEKNEGCNKMTCFKCGSFFCWLCGLRLSSTNPYSHFNTIGVPCYEKLFPEEELEFVPGEFLD